jgi:hypothetical protein
MKILICLLVLLLTISCSNFECSDIEKAVEVRCIEGEFDREPEYWDCFNEDTVNCDETAICINQFEGCDLSAIEGCLTGYQNCVATDCGAPAILDCPDSKYYHSNPEESEEGSSYVLSEAFAGCIDYRLSLDPEGYHAWVCLDGECLSAEEIEATVCGL